MQMMSGRVLLFEGDNNRRNDLRRTCVQVRETMVALPGFSA